MNQYYYYTLIMCSLFFITIYYLTINKVQVRNEDLVREYLSETNDTPRALTVDKVSPSEYRNLYVNINQGDKFTFQERVEPFMVNPSTGVRWVDKQKVKMQQMGSTGFQVWDSSSQSPLVYQCPTGWTWNGTRCVLRGICDDNHTGVVYRGLDKYHFKGLLVSSQQERYAQKVYAECNQTTLVLHHCPEGSVFSQLDQFVDKSKACVAYDPCLDLNEGQVHRISWSATTLKENEFYKCVGGASLLQHCPSAMVWNSAFHSCQTVNVCDENPEYWRKVSPLSYEYCRGRQLLSVHCPFGVDEKRRECKLDSRPPPPPPHKPLFEYTEYAEVKYLTKLTYWDANGVKRVVKATNFLEIPRDLVPDSKNYRKDLISIASDDTEKHGFGFGVHIYDSLVTGNNHTYAGVRPEVHPEPVAPRGRVPLEVVDIYSRSVKSNVDALWFPMKYSYIDNDKNKVYYNIATKKFRLGDKGWEEDKLSWVQNTLEPGYYNLNGDPMPANCIQHEGRVYCVERFVSRAILHGTILHSVGLVRRYGAEQMYHNGLMCGSLSGVWEDKDQKFGSTEATVDYLHIRDYHPEKYRNGADIEWAFLTPPEMKFSWQIICQPAMGLGETDENQSSWYGLDAPTLVLHHSENILYDLIRKNEPIRRSIPLKSIPLYSQTGAIPQVVGPHDPVRGESIFDFIAKHGDSYNDDKQSSVCQSDPAHARKIDEKSFEVCVGQHLLTIQCDIGVREDGRGCLTVPKVEKTYTTYDGVKYLTKLSSSQTTLEVVDFLDIPADLVPDSQKAKANAKHLVDEQLLADKQHYSSAIQSGIFVVEEVEAKFPKYYNNFKYPKLRHPEAIAPKGRIPLKVIDEHTMTIKDQDPEVFWRRMLYSYVDNEKSKVFYNLRTKKFRLNGKTWEEDKVSWVQNTLDPGYYNLNGERMPKNCIRYKDKTYIIEGFYARCIIYGTIIHSLGVVRPYGVENPFSSSSEVKLDGLVLGSIHAIKIFPPDLKRTDYIDASNIYRAEFFMNNFRYNLKSGDRDDYYNAPKSIESIWNKFDYWLFPLVKENKDHLFNRDNSRMYQPELGLTWINNVDNPENIPSHFGLKKNSYGDFLGKVNCTIHHSENLLYDEIRKDKDQSPLYKIPSTYASYGYVFENNLEKDTEGKIQTIYEYIEEHGDVIDLSEPINEKLCTRRDDSGKVILLDDYVVDVKKQFPSYLTSDIIISHCFKGRLVKTIFNCTFDDFQKNLCGFRGKNNYSG